MDVRAVEGRQDDLSREIKQFRRCDVVTRNKSGEKKKVRVSHVMPKSTGQSLTEDQTRMDDQNHALFFAHITEWMYNRIVARSHAAGTVQELSPIHASSFHVTAYARCM